MNGYDPLRAVQAAAMGGAGWGNVINTLLPLFSERVRQRKAEEQKLADLTRRQQIANILGMSYGGVPTTETAKYKAREQAIRGLGFTTPEQIYSIMFPQLGEQALRESQMRLHEQQIKGELARIENYGKMANLRREEIESLKKHRTQTYNLQKERYQREREHWKIMEDRRVDAEAKNLFKNISQTLLNRYDRIQRRAQMECGPMPVEYASIPVNPQTGVPVEEGTKGTITRMEYWKRCIDRANKEMESINKQLRVIENITLKSAGLPTIPEPEIESSPPEISTPTPSPKKESQKGKSWSQKWNEFWEGVAKDWATLPPSPMIAAPERNFSEEYKQQQAEKRQGFYNAIKALLGGF